MPEPPAGPGPPLTSSRPDVASRMTEPHHHNPRLPLPSELLTCPQRHPATYQDTPLLPATLPAKSRQGASFFLFLPRAFFSLLHQPLHQPPPARLGEGKEQSPARLPGPHAGLRWRQRAEGDCSRSSGSRGICNLPVSSVCLALASVLLSPGLFISVRTVAINSMIKKRAISASQ